MMRLPPFLRAAAALAVAAAVPRPVWAQVTTLDEGSFIVRRDGAPIGREEFRIVRQPAAGGVAYVARALGAYGERRLSPALQTDSSGTPLRYQLEIRDAGALLLRLTGQATGTRFVAQASDPRGEASREYLLPAAAVVLDDEIFHQYFTLGLRGRADTMGTVALLSPRRNARGTLRVVEREAARVTIGGTPLDATRVALVDARGERREVWLDARGRVLRVALPASGLVAERDDPPR